ncbi:MAG: zinc ribbon domain-containing protein [Mycobacteriales bacterium]
MVSAAPLTQQRLLALQALDAALDRLAHRRATLPELAELERLTARLDQLHQEIVRAETEDSDQEREQTKLEVDVEQVRTRSDRDRSRLDAGAVGSPRELENLQSEIVSLARRQADLEEQVLEVMERREVIESRLGVLRAERAMLTAERDAVHERRDAAYAEIEAATARDAEERVGVAAELPPELMSLYEKIRADKGGVGAAALQRGRCEGCHLSLSGVDLAAIRVASPDAVLRCEECRRILVRTPESGL